MHQVKSLQIIANSDVSVRRNCFGGAGAGKSHTQANLEILSKLWGTDIN